MRHRVLRKNKGYLSTSLINLLYLLLAIPSLSYAGNGQGDRRNTTSDLSGTNSTIDSSTATTTLNCIDSNELVCDTPSTCYEKFKVSSSSTIDLYRNYSLNLTHCNITRAVIVFTGRDRNPADYLNYVMKAAKTSYHSTDSIIISPFFRENTDSRGSYDLFWDRTLGSASNYDWAMGGLSIGPEPISAYTIIDKIINSLGNSQYLPNLKNIVLVGHSAGGQLTQRYALTGNYKNQNLTESFSYIVANPSSYAYLNEKRPVYGSTTSFATPNSTNCTSYNRWGYGLLRPNQYFINSDIPTLITQYKNRNITYLLGDADTLTDGIDATCYANMQGPNRYLRGTSFFNFMKTYYSGHNHKKLIVPGVGHSGSQMINSSQGISAIFSN